MLDWAIVILVDVVHFLKPVIVEYYIYICEREGLFANTERLFRLKLIVLSTLE